MADHVTAAFNAQMRALLAEREALDEWAWRLEAAKQEAAVRFDAETRALLVEREKLESRARLLVDKDVMCIVDSMVREAFLPHPYVDDDQAVHLQNTGMLKQKDNKRKASFLADDRPAEKMEPPPDDKKTPGSEVPKWLCAICKLDCQDANALASHVSSGRHKRMVKTFREEQTSLSRKNLSEMVGLKPTSGIREPLRKKKKKASLLTVSESWCALCQVNCSTSKGLLAHQAGRKHLRRMVFCESKKEANRVVDAQQI